MGLLKRGKKSLHIHNSVCLCMCVWKHAYVANILRLNKSLYEGLRPCKYSTNVAMICFQFELHALLRKIRNEIDYDIIFQSCFNVFSESQPVCHVNVIVDWKVVELGHLLRVAVCQMLVEYSHVFVCVGVCVCVCLHNCMHSSLLPCAYCAGLSVHGRVFLNYISALPNYLLCQGSCLSLGLPVGCHSMHE